MYAIVDCDNCFVSCERVFQPDLKGRPVVVLSNNDGCVVARSQEAKALGIKMGVPIYQIMPLVKEKGVEIRSSNYVLYADMSNRIMSILREEVGDALMEQYSIDEAFLSDPPSRDRRRTTGETDYQTIFTRAWGEALVKKIGQWTGMPVSIGIGPTRTLAKAATWYAKHYAGYHKVCLIDSEEKRIAALHGLDISEVWGVGWRSVDKYRGFGVQTAWDLTQRSSAWVRIHFTITGVRTWQELRGEDCIDTLTTGRRQTICTSRSFDGMVSDRQQLEMYVSNFAVHCAQKLRQEHSVAQLVTLFIQTNHHRPDLLQYDPSATVSLITPANNNFEIVNASLSILRQVWRPGYQFKRAGVIVSGISSDSAIQQDLFDTLTPEQRLKMNRLSKVMDIVNSRMGADTLQLGVQQFPVDQKTGQRSNFKDIIRHDHRSRNYTSNLEEILEVK